MFVGKLYATNALQIHIYKLVETKNALDSQEHRVIENAKVSPLFPQMPNKILLIFETVKN